MSQSVRPGNRERGWNDPPEFLHSEEGSSEPPKRTILNQRVHHSLDALTTSTANEQNSKPSEPPKLNAPPISQTPVSNVNADKKSEEKSEIKAQVTDVSIEDIENIFNLNVKYLRDNELGGRTCDDILKRIKIFVTNWPKLNDTIKFKMSELAKALEKSELNTANDLHVRLMLDFPSDVSQWMVGIKKLIHELIELKNKKENSIDNSEICAN